MTRVSRISVHSRTLSRTPRMSDLQTSLNIKSGMRSGLTVSTGERAPTIIRAVCLGCRHNSTRCTAQKRPRRMRVAGYRFEDMSRCSSSGYSICNVGKGREEPQGGGPCWRRRWRQHSLNDILCAMRTGMLFSCIAGLARSSLPMTW